MNLSRLATWFSISSIIISIAIVGSSPGALIQTQELEFPLTGLGERVIEMFIPIILSSVSGLLSILVARNNISMVLLMVLALGWALIWGILGKEGFNHLF